MTFWLAAPTALLVTVHQRYRAENIGDFGTHLKLVLALSGVGRIGLCRRHAFGFLKAYPHEYWAANLYLRAFASDRWRFKLFHFMLDGYPSQLGPSANIVLTAKRPDSAPADVRTKVVAAASWLLRQDQTRSALSGWDAIFLAKMLLLFDSLDLAYRAVKGACLPENDTATRFEGLLTMARIVAQGLAGLLAHVRCLVTATRIYPDHVGINEVLRELADLLKTMGHLRISQDTLELELGRCEGIVVDGQLDIAEGCQAWLQLPEYMREGECARAAFYSASVDFQTVIEGAACCIKLPPSGLEIESDRDAWLVATTQPEVYGHRLPVYRAKLKQVCFQNGSHWSFFSKLDGTILKLFSSGHSSSFGRAYIETHNPVSLSGSFVDLTLAYGHDNYSHFLLDRIPRLTFAPAGEFKESALLVDEKLVTWTREILDLLGDRREIVPVRMGLVYRLNEVVTFSRTQHPAQSGSNQYVSFLKSLAPTKGARRKRRIFIHRDRGRRGIANEEEFYETLSVHEIEVLRLETLGLRQQIEIFSDAEFVMGVHGAGLSNLVFCDTGTAVVEIIPLNYSTATYTILSSQIGHRHMCYIEPSETNRLLATKSQFSDTMVEIPRWTEFLNRCVAQLL